MICTFFRYIYPYECIQVISDESFARHDGFDLASFDEKNWPLSDLPIFRVLKQETYAVFKKRVAEHCHYPEHRIRLWQLISRQNKTLRPGIPIPEDQPALSKLLRNCRRYFLITFYLRFRPEE